MKSLIINTLLLELLFALSNGYDNNTCGWNINTKIIGGTAASKGQFPWMVSIEVNGVHVYGGSLVAPNLVLTCAHCVNMPMINTFVVRAGVTNLLLSGGTEQDSQIAAIFIHPAYNETTIENDVALIQLATPITRTSAVHEICLPPPGTSFVGQTCTATGWGLFDTSMPNMLSASLQMVSLPIVDLGTCQNDLASFGRPITSSQLCAGYAQGGKDACTYDGGGPLACADVNGTYTIAGIVSWGKGCALPNYPGVYASVSSYTTWIQQVQQQIASTSTPLVITNPSAMNVSVVSMSSAGYNLSIESSFEYDSSAVAIADIKLIPTTYNNAGVPVVLGSSSIPMTQMITDMPPSMLQGSYVANPNLVNATAVVPMLLGDSKAFFARVDYSSAGLSSSSTMSKTSSMGTLEFYSVLRMVCGVMNQVATQATLTYPLTNTYLATKENYATNVNCSWTYQLPTSSANSMYFIQIEFMDIVCPDSLTIYDASTGAKLFGPFCGRGFTSGVQIGSTGVRSLTVNFVSTASTSGAQGFSILLDTSPIPIPTVGATAMSTADSYVSGMPVWVIILLAVCGAAVLVSVLLCACCGAYFCITRRGGQNLVRLSRRGAHNAARNLPQAQAPAPVVSDGEYMEHGAVPSAEKYAVSIVDVQPPAYETEAQKAKAAEALKPPHYAQAFTPDN